MSDPLLFPPSRQLPVLYFVLPQHADAVRALGERFGLPFGGALPAQTSATPADPAAAERPALVYAADGLSLHAGGCHREVIRADFLAGRTGYRLGTLAHTSQPLLRAIGFRAPPFRLLDATAGLGADGILCACAGCEVTLCERSPVMGALLADALARAQADPEFGAVIAQRVRLRTEDARAVLRAEGDGFDAVYLDPMFPPRKKAALVKKEMRLARLIADEGEDAAELLLVARAAARRVVVKRPLKAPALGEGFVRQIKGRSVRFDLYGF